MTTPELAKSYFADQISFAATHGEDQLTFSIGQILQEFHNRSFQALRHAILGDAVAKRTAAAAAGNAPIDARFASVDIEGGEGLVVRLDDGSRHLVGWWTKTNDDDNDPDASPGEEPLITQKFGIIPFRETAPDALIDQIDRAVESATKLRDLDDLAKQAMLHGGFNDDDIDLYGDLPLSLDEIVRAIGQHGIEEVFDAKALSVVTSVKLESMGRAHSYGHSRSRDVSLLARIASAFELDASGRSLPRNLKPHLKALLAGELEELHASVVAMAMSRTMETRSATIGELVEKADAMSLSKDLSFAYNDTDVRISMHHHDGADAFFHENIDLNEGNAFITVLNGKAGAYRSLDVYLVEPWHRENDDDSDADEELDDIDRSDFSERAEFMAGLASNDHRIGEDELHVAIADGQRPATGRALSYDIESRSIELFPALVHTDYVSLLPTILEFAVRAMDRAMSSERHDMLGAEFHRRDEGATTYESIPLDDHLGPIAPNP